MTSPQQTQNVNVVTNVNTPNSRGAGTVLMFLFFWPVLVMWWTLLSAVWLVWLIVAGVTSIFQHDFFARTWYYPWPVWMFGIR